MTEWIKAILDAPQPGQVLRDMFGEGNIPPLTFLADADGISAGPVPWHTGTVLGHVSRVMDEVATATGGDKIAIWMALAHDAGKMTTPRSMLPHHYGHEFRGRKMARQWAREAELPKDFARAGVFAASQHMKAGRFQRLTPKNKLRYLLELAESGLMERLFVLCSADRRTDIGEYGQAHWDAISPLVKGYGDREIPQKIRLECLNIIKGMPEWHDPREIGQKS